MADLSHLLGWLVVGILVVGLFVALHRRKRANKSSATMPVDYAVTPKRVWTWDALTKREMQIARLVAAGKRNAAIAAELHISVHTVESHVKHIYTKLDVRNRAELTNKIRELTE